MKKLLNIEYGAIQGTYWMYYGVIASFASVYLLAKEYSNSAIGIILATANVVAVILQPVVAEKGDNLKKGTLCRLVEIQVIALAAMTLCLFIFREKSIFLTLLFVALIAWHTAIQPLINSLAFYLKRTGHNINFGICRSAGSLAYAMLTAGLGIIVEKCGVISIPVTGIVTLAVMIGVLHSITAHYIKAVKENRRMETEEEGFKGEKTISMSRFIKTNTLFIIFSVGVIGLFFGNAVINNFMIQVVTAVGGSSDDMGIILGVMAALELPALIFFDQLRKRFTCQLMIKVSAIGFFIKILFIYLAKSVTMLILAQLCQIFSFGLFLSAMVHFIDEVMKKEEAVRGQAIFTIMTTAGAVFASFFGGIILDKGDASLLLLISTILTALGAALLIFLVDRIKKK